MLTPHNTIKALTAARDALAAVNPGTSPTSCAFALSAVNDELAAIAAAPKPPIKSGWKGNINGHLERTEGSQIEVSEITLKLDRATAYALANLLSDSAIERSCSLEQDQAKAMSNLGAALGRMLDHHAANNGGREIVK